MLESLVIDMSSLAHGMARQGMNWNALTKTKGYRFGT